jgi:DNA polymerase-4
MDAFYASIEQREHPGYRGKPVAVGGSGLRGVVAAASYEARRYGVFSAMPSVTAKKKCPELIFVKPRFDLYRRESVRIRNIFFEYTDLVEPLSLDEAYLDITENKKGIPSATLIAKAIRKQIVEETGLTASAGVSINKFLAKIASDQDKPDGLFVIPPEKAQGFVEQLPVEKFHGVGKVTAQKMHQLGIMTGKDLKDHDEAFLVRHFGKAGRFFYQIARARDDRPVNPHRERKSVGAERTFDRDHTGTDELKEHFEMVSHILAGRIASNKVMGKTVVLKIKFADFRQITRSHTMPEATSDPELIHREGLALLDAELPVQKGVRLLGLSLTGLVAEGKTGNIQLTIEF